MATALDEFNGELLQNTSTTISFENSSDIYHIHNNLPDIDVDDHDYEDEYGKLPNIKPLTPTQQRRIFVTAFLPNKCPEDITSLISDKWLDPEFKWNLGLLEWRPYTHKTTKLVADTYGRNANTLASINYAISKCMTRKRFDIVSIRKDIMETSPNKSWLVYFIVKNIAPNLQKGVDLYREKWKMHNMLYQIVAPSHGSFISPTHSHSRDIRVMALQCIPSPPMGFELQSSMTMVSMSPLSLPHIMDDIDVDDIDSSFILDTLSHEYPERDATDTRRLHDLLLAFNRIPSTKEVQYISMDIDQCMEEKLAKRLLRTECMDLIPHNKPYIISKMIDILNRKGVIMNIVNLFTELRMASHYIEMFKRSHNEYIMDMDLDSDDSEDRLPLEPFGMYENVLTISEFLRNYPLFETLRSQLKYDYIIHCMSSTVTHIINKVVRPLPFQPRHIIHDSYTDFLMYTSQISRFIYNKIVNQHRFNKFKYLDDVILNALHFPCQLDFLIIPQCVSEYKIKHQHHVIHDYEQQCDQLLFSIGGQRVDNIGEILGQIQFKEFEIDREPAHFYKTLTRGFNKVQKKNWRKRHQRYVFVIDRRNPTFDGKYCLNNNEKTWKDKLYIFSPPKYNKISSQCDILPEGFINRTMQYLLPGPGGDAGAVDVIGANCVANGYIFCESYHLYQEDKIKRYFHYNGHSQRFTKDELKYYFPRLFMKIDGKFQNELNIKNNQASLAMFKEIQDEEHQTFHQQTMK